MMSALLSESAAELSALLRDTSGYLRSLQQAGDACMSAWRGRGKVLTAGNGGSAADAVHLAEELSVRFSKNRQALAAVSLIEGAAITCAANDYGYDEVFARQVEALGNPGDVLIVFSTSGNSRSILRALERARARRLVTCSFLGRDGGQARGLSDIELIVPSATTARIQEMHQLLFHTLCQWIDAQYPEVPLPQ